jgi:hypothetical protein
VVADAVNCWVAPDKEPGFHVTEDPNATFALNVKGFPLQMVSLIPASTNAEGLMLTNETAVLVQPFASDPVTV